MICEYITHTQGTIDFINQYSENFHKLKDEYSEFHLGKKGKKTTAKVFTKNLGQLETKALYDILGANPEDEDIDDEYDSY